MADIVGEYISHLELLANAKINVVDVLERPPKNESASPSKMCFNTASTHVKNSSNSVYVLGYIVLNGAFAFEHAWVWEHGQFYDLTLNPRTAVNYNLKQTKLATRIDYVEVWRVTRAELMSEHMPVDPDLSCLNEYLRITTQSPQSTTDREFDWSRDENQD